MRRALLFALTLFALPALAEDLQPFSASYTADWKQLPVSGRNIGSQIQFQFQITGSK